MKNIISDRQGSRQRDPMFDALKFFAIFLVLWGHSIQHLTTQPVDTLPVYRVIYSFHMPLFMAIVGYFSANVKDSFASLFNKKFRQLLIPAATMGVIFLISGYCKGGGKHGPLVSGISDFISCLWFLKSAFICAILYFAAVKWSSRPLIAIIITLILSQFIVMYKVYLMYPCFLFGVLLNTNIDFVRRYSFRLMLSGGAVFLAMLIFWDGRFWTSAFTSIYIGKLRDLHQAYLVYYRLIIGLAGTMFFVTAFICIFKRVDMTPALNKVCQLGQETLGIYLLQTFLLEMLLASFVKLDGMDFWLYNFVITPLISLIVLIVCVWIIGFIKKSRVASFLILGKKL